MVLITIRSRHGLAVRIWLSLSSSNPIMDNDGDWRGTRPYFVAELQQNFPVNSKQTIWQEIIII